MNNFKYHLPAAIGLHSRWMLLGLAGTLCLLIPPAGAQGGAAPVLVSVNAAGTGSGNGQSSTSHRIDGPQRLLSRDGRFVVFFSAATDLVGLPDANGAFSSDVFVRDLTPPGRTELVSVNAAGTASGNGHSVSATISDDGRYVCFVSSATDLAPGVTDTNSVEDVYVRDLQTKVTTLVSVIPAGTSSGNQRSRNPVMTPSGRFVAFKSLAANLAAGIVDVNDAADVYLRDLEQGKTSLVSSDPTGQSALGAWEDGDPAISDDGLLVAFYSSADGLVAEDRNFLSDVFIRDLTPPGRTELISVNAAGSAAGNGHSVVPVMTPDGRFVAFLSKASNLAPGVNDTNSLDDLYVRDRVARVTRMASVNAAGTDSGNDLMVTSAAALTRDGRFVAFTSLANDLVAGIRDLPRTHDVFARDMVAGRTALVSVNGAGDAAGNGISGGREAISDDGRFVAFASAATDLVTNDTNGPQVDIFQRDVLAGRTFLVSGNAAGTGSGNRASGADALAMTRDGGLVLFGSAASDLVPNDSNGPVNDVFIAAPAGAPPSVVITNCKVSPTALPTAGGAVTLSVEVTSSSPLARVFATITRPDNTTVEVNLARGAGSTFSGTFTAPANALPGVRTYRVAVTAVQVAGGRADISGPPFTVAAAGDSTPPSLTSYTVNPRAISHRGGSIGVKVLATDNVRVAGVTATFTRAGVSTVVTLLAVVGRGFVGSFPAPANPTSQIQTYTISITMADSAGNRATVPGGEATVAADNVPPVLSGYFLAGPAVSFRGEVSIAVVAQDGGRVDRVTATFTGGGQVYTGQFVLFSSSQYLLVGFHLPINTTRQAQGYRIEVVATDAAGNRASLNGGFTNVLAAPRERNKPTLPYCLISPTSLSAAGGEVTVLLVADDDTLLAQVLAVFIRGDVSTAVTLTQVETGQPFYRGTFTAPANRTAEPQEYVFRAAAVDIWGNTQIGQFGTVTVAPGAP